MLTPIKESGDLLSITRKGNEVQGSDIEVIVTWVIYCLSFKISDCLDDRNKLVDIIQCGFFNFRKPKHLNLTEKRC